MENRARVGGLAALWAGLARALRHALHEVEQGTHDWQQHEQNCCRWRCMRSCHCEAHEDLSRSRHHCVPGEPFWIWPLQLRSPSSRTRSLAVHPLRVPLLPVRRTLYRKPTTVWTNAAGVSVMCRTCECRVLHEHLCGLCVFKNSDGRTILGSGRPVSPALTRLASVVLLLKDSHSTRPQTPAMVLFE